jgi:hypothetical protein
MIRNRPPETAMFARTLIIVAALAVATPVLAIQSPGASPATTADPSAIAPVEAAAAEFEVRMNLMGDELFEAAAQHPADDARYLAAVDTILQRYQPDVDRFLAATETYLATQAAAAPDDEARAAIAVDVQAIRTTLNGFLPGIRTGLAEARSQATAAR